MKRIVPLVALSITLCLSFGSLSFAGVIFGRVVHVADGDTVTVRDILNRKHRVRLYGIDCPESGQEFGDEAARHAAQLAAGKVARVVKYDKDRYGRVVGVVMVDGVNVNQSLIENGYAWKYRKYCKESFCKDWRRLEEKAKRARLGLWSDETPVAPWDWRREQREGTAAVVGKPARPGSKGGPARGYSGNVNSRVFHDAECKHFDCKNCLEQFSEREQALQKGYRPCGMCSP